MINYTEISTEIQAELSVLSNPEWPREGEFKSQGPSLDKASDSSELHFPPSPVSQGIIRIQFLRHEKYMLIIAYVDFTYEQYPRMSSLYFGVWPMICEPNLAYHSFL